MRTSSIRFLTSTFLISTIFVTHSYAAQYRTTYEKQTNDELSQLIDQSQIQQISDRTPHDIVSVLDPKKSRKITRAKSTNSISILEEPSLQQPVEPLPKEEGFWSYAIIGGALAGLAAVFAIYNGDSNDHSSSHQGDSGSGDTGSGDTGSGDTGSGDTGSGDTGSGDTGSGDTGSGDTGSGDTGSGDTGSGDTGSGDTGSGDTGSGDTGSGDTGSGDTGSGDTGSGDTGSGDTGSGDTGSGDTGSGDTGSGDTGSGDTGSGDTGSGDTGSGDTGSGDTGSGDTGSGDTGSGDTGSGDTGSGDTGSGDTGSGDTGSGDTGSGDTGSGDTGSGDTGSGDTGSGDTGSGDTGSGDTGSGDTGSGDTGSGDTGSGDTGSGDTGSGDTGSGDTGSGDTGSGDTGSGDTGSGDTGSGDTGSGDTGSGDTGSGDTGSGDTGSGDTGSGDTGSGDTGGTGDGDNTGSNDGDGDYNGDGDWDSTGGNGGDGDSGSGSGDGGPFDGDSGLTQWHTLEYISDGALHAINAHTRYSSEDADGNITINPNGTGVTLSIVSTGINADHLEFAGKDLKGVDYGSSGTSWDEDNLGIGTLIASRMVGNKNDTSLDDPYFDDGRESSQGVAYNADLAVFKVMDTDQTYGLIGSYMGDIVTKSNEWGSISITNTWTLADEGNMPLSVNDITAATLEYYTGSGFIDAMNAADELGIISVFPTGDNGALQPNAAASLPVYFSDLADTVVAVTAVNNDGNILGISNRCGLAMDFCLSAPGSSIIGADATDTEQYTSMSGTYIATAFVSGSIALIKSNFPEMTGPEILELLKNTATDLGDAGVDAVYGHGMINLENAYQPQGTITVQTGSTIQDGAIPLANSTISGPASITSTLSASLSGTNFMVSDDYNRGFQANLGAMVSEDRNSMNDLTGNISSFIKSSFAVFDTQKPVSMGFNPDGIDREKAKTWINAGAFASPYASLVDAPIFRMKNKFDFGSVAFSAMQDKNGSNYSSIELGIKPNEATDLSFEIGQANETNRMLGTKFTGAYGENLATSTQFTRLIADFSFDHGFGLMTSASIGSTSFSSDGIFSSGNNITTTAYGAGLYKTGVFDNQDSISFGVSRPLSIIGGTLNLDLPTSMAAAEGDTRSDTVNRTQQTVSLVQSDKITDLQLGYTSPVFGGKFNIGAAYRMHSLQENEYSLGAGFNMNF